MENNQLENNLSPLEVRVNLLEEQVKDLRYIITEALLKPKYLESVADKDAALSRVRQPKSSK